MFICFIVLSQTNEANFGSLSFIMKKQDNFLKEVVSFMKTLAKCTA